MGQTLYKVYINCFLMKLMKVINFLQRPYENKAKTAYDS